jgi:4-diphosphocytidyl-2-C-methyl-D-erythritol kinase
MMGSELESTGGWVQAPAKVNLFLSVGRPDRQGYHPLRTVFQAIGVYDRIHIAIGTGKCCVAFDVDEIPENNSITKAIELYAALTNLPPVTVRVLKGIPLQSGLGGGSSDAATVLQELQRRLGSPVPVEELSRIAAKVGADVPFFLVGGKARAEGYGEILKPMADEPTRWLLIACPEERCSTGLMFKKLDDLNYEWREFPEKDTIYNDFERVAPCACLELIERMRIHGAASAGLSGSGSAVFGVFDTRELAEHGARKLQAEGVPWVRVAPTLSREDSLSSLPASA